MLQDALTVLDAPYGSHQLCKFGSGGGAPVMVAVGSGLAVPGYTMIADDSIAADVYAALASKVICSC